MPRGTARSGRPRSRRSSRAWRQKARSRHGSEDDVLHLELTAARESLDGYERALVDGFFFDGRTATSTSEVRAHYSKPGAGFYPDAVIRRGVAARVAALVGTDTVAVAPLIPAGAALLAGALVILTASTDGFMVLSAGALLGLPALVFGLAGMAFAGLWRDRVDHGLRETPWFLVPAGALMILGWAAVGDPVWPLDAQPRGGGRRRAGRRAATGRGAGGDRLGERHLRERALARQRGWPRAPEAAGLGARVLRARARARGRRRCATSGSPTCSPSVSTTRRGAGSSGTESRRRRARPQTSPWSGAGLPGRAPGPLRLPPAPRPGPAAEARSAARAPRPRGPRPRTRSRPDRALRCRSRPEGRAVGAAGAAAGGRAADRAGSSGGGGGSRSGGGGGGGW